MTVHHGTYTIVNVATHTALDSNTGGASQLSSSHPRPFLWTPVPSAHNHQWDIKHAEGDWFNIVAHGTNKALDGNVSVPQVATSHPHPFLWDTVPSAHNHQWRFQKVGHDTYLIVNRANGLALDGNVTGAPQHSSTHAAPFLWTPVEHAHNHQWVLTRL